MIPSSECGLQCISAFTEQKSSTSEVESDLKTALARAENQEISVAPSIEVPDPSDWHLHELSSFNSWPGFQIGRDPSRRPRGPSRAQRRLQARKRLDVLSVIVRVGMSFRTIAKALRKREETELLVFTKAHMGPDRQASVARPADPRNTSRRLPVDDNEMD